MLLGIHVYNYRVLRDVRLGVCREDFNKSPDDKAYFPLRALAVLVGENRSGKSSLIEALAFLRETILYGLKPKERKRPSLQEFRTFGETEAPAIGVTLLAPSLRAILFYHMDLAECEGEAVIKAESLERMNLSREWLEALDWEELLPCEEPSEPEYCFRRTSEGKLFYDNVILNTLSPERSALSDKELSERCPEAAYLRDYFKRIRFLYMPDAEGEVPHLPPYDYAAEKQRVPNRSRLLRQELEELREKDYAAYEHMSRGLMRVLNLGSDAHILHWLSRLTEAEKKLALITMFLLSHERCSLLCIENPDYGLFPDKVDNLARELRDYVISSPDAQVILTTSHMNLLESTAPREVWTFTHHEQERDPHGLKPEDVPEIRVRPAAADPLICAMYEEGVGLGTLLYGGYLA